MPFTRKCYRFWLENHAVGVNPLGNVTCLSSLEIPVDEGIVCVFTAFRSVKLKLPTRNFTTKLFV